MGLADISLPINEGLGPRLENTMPYIFDPSSINTTSLAQQIIDEPIAAPSVIEQAEIIAQAAWEPLNTADILAEADSILFPTQEIATLPSVARNDVWVEPVIVPILEEQTLRSVPTQPENRPAVAQAVSQVLEQAIPQEQEIEEEVVEIIKAEDKEQDLEDLPAMLRIALQAGEELEVNKFVEDEEASSVRKHEVREAVSRAKQEANRLGLKSIAGWLVAKFLPPEHAGNRSQIVKESGPDGSYTETIEAISGVGQLDPDIAVKRFELIVEEKKPVKLGKDGQQVEQQDLSRVLKYKFFKPKAEEIIVKRFVKKKVPQSFIQKNDLKTDIKKQEAPEWVSEVGEYKLAA